MHLKQYVINSRKSMSLFLFCGNQCAFGELKWCTIAIMLYLTNFVSVFSQMKKHIVVWPNNNGTLAIGLYSHPILRLNVHGSFPKDKLYHKRGNQVGPGGYFLKYLYCLIHTFLPINNITFTAAKVVSFDNRGIHQL